MHLGIGYDIPGIGFVRAQYIGGFMGRESDPLDMFRLTEPSKFEAAFALTAVDNLTLDMGVKYWTPVEIIDRFTIDDGQVGVERSFRGIDAAIGANYRYDDFGISVMAQVLHLFGYTGMRTHRDDNKNGADGAHFVFNMIPSYGFDWGTVGLSFIFQTKFADTSRAGVTDETSAWTRFGAGAWYSKGLAGGSIKTGITWAPPPIRTGQLVEDGPLVTGFNGRGTITIPVILEYAFF
jgi:hypothetical protein